MSTTNDPTFRHYKPIQASSYAKHRGSYNDSLYSTILSYHTSTGGTMNTLLDVGCGHGNATRELAMSFQKAIGVDPGEEMINQAKIIGGKTAAGIPIEWAVGNAESVGEKQGIEVGSVDVLSAAMAVSMCS
jgi:2-polyprenyl-3-methyl-5-hydroxy-6-metoxy-1,4-benzoquinol methylase